MDLLLPPLKMPHANTLKPGERNQKSDKFLYADPSLRPAAERNHVAEVLGVEPGQVAEGVASVTGRSLPQFNGEIQKRAVRFFWYPDDQASSICTFRRSSGRCS